MRYEYKTENTCSQSISFDINDNVITNILFLGCSYYAFDVDAEVKNFIVENKDKIGKIVCFGTSAMMKSMKKPVSKVAEPLGVIVAEEEFHCRGQFGKMHKGRPNVVDLNEASAFAKRVISR